MINQKVLKHDPKSGCVNDAKSKLAVTATILFTVLSSFFFTFISSLFSRAYLELTSDVYTLTFLVLFLPALFALVYNTTPTNSAFDRLSYLNLIKNQHYLSLGLFHLGSVLFTSIGINQTSVHFTFIIKSIEPIFTILMRRFVLGKTTQLLNSASFFVLIFMGTFFILTDDDLSETELTSCVWILAANLASASRNTFAKSSDHLSNEKSEMFVLANISLFAFVLYLPIYAFLRIYRNNTFDPNGFAIKYETINFLALASLLSFVDQMLTFRMLTQIKTISHSCINTINRSFTAICSILFVDSSSLGRVSLRQCFGFVLTNLGVLFYLVEKSNFLMSYNRTKREKSLGRKILVGLISSMILINISFSITFTLKIEQTDVRPDDFVTLEELSPRIICIRKIQDQIRTAIRPLVSNFSNVGHLIDFPNHMNYGDSFIWYGEELLLQELGIQVRERLHESDKRSRSTKYLHSHIDRNDLIFFQGGGNFGDLYRFVMDFRHRIMTAFPTNKFILFPQTINYRNASWIEKDRKFLSTIADLTIMTRSFESFEFATNTFKHNTIRLVPDMAFMIGAIRPRRRQPIVDILVMRRIDKEANFPTSQWSLRLTSRLEKEKSITYLLIIYGKIEFYLVHKLKKVRDWTDFPDVKDLVKNKGVEKLAAARVDLGNDILSQGRVIITDRLHVSIMSLLMGKPHVMVNEKYGKVRNTRETAFENKTECSEQNLNGFYVENIQEAIEKAIEMILIERKTLENN